MSDILGKAGHVSARLGFDTGYYVSIDQAKAMLASGYAFVVRYLRRDEHVNQTPDLSGGLVSLSIKEAQDLIATGMQLSLVQFGESTLVPSADEGASAGAAAAANAGALGVPAGVTLWCDLEWTSAAKPSDSAPVLDYVNAWAARVVAAGYRAGLYLGPNVPLSADELYHDLAQITGYWKSASHTVWVAERGFQMIQGLSFQTCGLAIDPDMACFDGKGDRFYVVEPA